ncbi:MAG: 6,7-dimethyl-8-ribityllumazine synthase [Bacteroidetes bacterium]|nr:6,7-dimethyl-8-ribityllumazine synthase [Bacteroidota bacterium]
MPRSVHGTLHGAGRRIVIVAARWNEFIVNRLQEGALEALRANGVDDADITIVYCPGSYEVPSVALHAAQTLRPDAIITLGAVIRGDTPHFEYVSGPVSTGIATVAMQTGIPCIFGVLTVNTVDQAMERAGVKGDNKGYEAAVAALEMISIYEQIRTL